MISHRNENSRKTAPPPHRSPEMSAPGISDRETHRLRRTRPICGLLVLAGLTSVWHATAQEALRASLAGQMALEAKRQRIASGWGDLRLGPVKLDLNSQLALSGSDNVRYREDDKDADLIVSPSINVRALWPVTEKNVLSFGAGIGYNKYFSNSDLDYLFITPGSDLTFDVYVGDFVINFHNRFHYTADVASQTSQPGQLGGRQNYGYFDDQLGVLVLWDLNKAVVSLNYDHQIYFATTSIYDYTDHTSELFGLRTAWLITPVTPLGLEFGFGLTDYNQSPSTGLYKMNDLMQYSFGAFYEMPSGKLSSLRLAAGYVVYDPTTDVTTTPATAMDAFYADLSFSHRVTERIRYTLALGQQVRSGLNAQTLRFAYARAHVNWNVFRGYSLGTSIGYEIGEESGGQAFSEDFDRFYGTISVSKRLSADLSAGLSYSHYQRNSDGDYSAYRSYAENRLVLSVTYAF